jgi:hypothetical protein
MKLDVSPNSAKSRLRKLAFLRAGVEEHDTTPVFLLTNKKHPPKVVRTWMNLLNSTVSLKSVTCIMCANSPAR